MGHALEFVRADVIARWKTQNGYDVYFNTGTDEHGVKIYQKAVEAGVSAQAFVDAGFETFKQQVAMFGVMPETHFIRTTDEKHIRTAEEFWTRVYNNGFIYKKTYQAKYCVGCESEKTDSELVDGYCPLHPGVPLELIDEENYFFRYSAFGEKLMAFYASRPDFIVPEFRFNEMKAFVERGLSDFSVSRLKEKMPWGIPVPNDPDHVMYVWFDALVNYISTLDVFDQTSTAFETFWKNGTPTQYCGKDNTRFQGIMWQAMLMAANLPNSHQIIVNGFITGEGGVRMSKTIGNVVDPRDVVGEFGTDALRLFLIKEVSPFEDSPFTKERFLDVYNSALANGLGNLASRTLAMAVSRGGTIARAEPIRLSYTAEGFGAVEEIDAGTIEEFISTKTIPGYESAMARFEQSKAAECVWELITLLDRTIARTEPYRLVKTDPVKAEAILYDLLCGLSTVTTLLMPLLPETAGKLREHIGAYADKRPEAFTVKKFETPLFPRK